MWNKIIEIAKTAAAMLHSGQVPPNTPAQYKEELGAINFLRSKKFFMVFFAVILLISFGVLGVFGLFLTAALPTITIPYVTLVCKVFDMLAIIIGIWLGAQTSLDFVYGSSSNIDLQGSNQNITETLEEKHTYIEESRSRPDYEEAD